MVEGTKTEVLVSYKIVLVKRSADTEKEQRSRHARSVLFKVHLVSTWFKHNVALGVRFS